VVKAAARRWDNGQVIVLLLNAEVEITEDIVKVAAGNDRSGPEIMALLLNNIAGSQKR
jgi:hypothetical protein